ncbi:hypothetical protein D3C78_1782000 [compost metagenome]
MGLRANRDQIQPMRQIVVTGANQIGEFVFQRADNGLLHLAGEAATAAKVHQLEA